MCVSKYMRAAFTIWASLELLKSVLEDLERYSLIGDVSRSKAGLEDCALREAGVVVHLCS